MSEFVHTKLVQRSLRSNGGPSCMYVVVDRAKWESQKYGPGEYDLSEPFLDKEDALDAQRALEAFSREL